MNTSATWLLAFACVALFGCDDAASPKRSNSESKAAALGRVDVPSDRQGSADFTTSSQGNIVGAGAATAPASFRSAPQRAGKQVDALTIDQRATLHKTEAKVLLPTNSSWLKRAFITADTHWYTASIDEDGYTIVIEGNSKSIAHPEIRAAFATSPPTRQSPRISRNELIVEASFVEDGTAYSIEVECVLPDKNPRCTNDTFISKVVDSLSDFTSSRPLGVPR